MMRTLFLIIVALFLTGCVQNEDVGSQIKWGHLDETSLIPSSPQYLINKKPDESYKVCLAEYMVDRFPGIKAEIDAAINIWGHYIGRTIPVEITIKDLPRAVEDDSSQTQSKQYYAKCGVGFDVVIGLTPFQGSAVGVTGASYSYYPNRDGSIKITSFTRFLFLRDYQASPSPWKTEQDWISLEDRHEVAYAATELKELMIERDRTEFSHANRSLTAPVLTHEFGHVWGLCDQYQGVENCDKTFSTPEKVEDSIMGASSGREKLYLTDDDIEGIRALANREGFSKGWEDVAKSLETAPVEMKAKDVELFEIEEVKAEEGNKMVVVYSIVTNKKTRYSFEVRRKGTSRWSALSSYYESEDSGANSVSAVMNISLYDDPSKFDVRIKLNMKNDLGEDIVPMFAEG